jgi:LDH2 family malate/lactate/ureidoglycolate dehydrogenase
MATNEIYMSAETLKEFVKNAFIKMGFCEEDAELGADSLLWANLRGIDSHGIQRITLFGECMRNGQLNAHPNIRVIKETPAITFIDADRALGAVSATFAMKRSIEKARNVGIGWTLVTNTTTPLAIGYYTLMAVRAGMAGIGATFSRPLMAPYGGKDIGVHNGPISIAVPAAHHRPVILDMATSTVAYGKVEVAQDKGISIPPDWALDEHGQPTTDPFAARVSLPFGTYKGSGLAFMFECLTSIMAGDPLCAPWLTNVKNDPRHRQNSIMAAIDVSMFSDLSEYKDNVDNLVDSVKAVPKADGFDEILVPGELEDRICAERMANGIPLPPGTIVKMKTVAEWFDVELPAGL